MAPDTQTIDFNATVLTLGSGPAAPFERLHQLLRSNMQSSETVSAATKRVDLR